MSVSYKKEWDLAIFDNMDGPSEYNAKWNKSDRERQMPYDFTHKWNLKKKNKQNRNRLINNREQTDSLKGGGGETGKIGEGIKRHKVIK